MEKVKLPKNFGKIKNKKIPADNFFESLNDNQKELKELIMWAKFEIKEYEKVIKLIEKRLKKII